MTISTLAFGKANASGSLKLVKYTAVTKHATNFYSTVPASSPSNGAATHPKPVDAATQRELFMNVLTTNTTKRDAKQYLSRFKAPKPSPPQEPNISSVQEERNARHRRDQDRLDRMGVNLGELYAPARAIAETAIFTREEPNEKTATSAEQTMHVALACLRSPEKLDEETLDGVALTLSQLIKLDMRILIVLDCGVSSKPQGDGSASRLKQMFTEQAGRLNKAIAKYSPEGARLVLGALEVEEVPVEPHGQVIVNTAIGLPNLLMDPLKRSIIPIIPTLAYTSSGQLLAENVTQVMSALTRMLLGASTTSALPSDKVTATSLDRIILLDPIGGIPSKARKDGAHVFINLEQELEKIDEELDEYTQAASSNGQGAFGSVYQQHRANLHTLGKCLALLPAASSALIITPQEAASSSQTSDAAESTIGAGTRRQKNTLIHNLLTNKPVVSPSLPVARLSSAPTTNDEEIAPRRVPTATLLKRGMPLSIIPSAGRTGLGWQAPALGSTELNLATDPRVDLPRLVYLIENSFRRKLDVQHYLARIQHRIAGLIIAGSYEGAAILTWEQPSGTSDPRRLVPYLDKFAVLSSSQGSSGVADILFQSMVRTCFPKGVCWRSRKDNPVNKWYFERADGHWQIPGTNWTMFWTGEGIAEDKQRWDDYVSVCTNIGPSWADGKKPD